MGRTQTMTVTTRDRADWMMPVDERILELLDQRGNLTPRYVSKTGVCSQSYASDRLSMMARYGLVDRMTHGLYRLTDDGKGFLGGEVDASGLTVDG